MTWSPEPGAVLREALSGLLQFLDRLPCDCTMIPGLSRNGGWAITTIAIHLNDFHEWTREAIADWVETLDVDLTFGI